MLSMQSWLEKVARANDMEPEEIRRREPEPKVKGKEGRKRGERDTAEHGCNKQD